MEVYLTRQEREQVLYVSEVSKDGSKRWQQKTPHVQVIILIP